MQTGIQTALVGTDALVGHVSLDRLSVTRLMIAIENLVSPGLSQI